MEMYKHELSTPKPPCHNKVHKPSTPIRPIINWKNVPVCELVKYLSQTLCKLPAVYIQYTQLHWPNYGPKKHKLAKAQEYTHVTQETCTQTCKK
jgi:hypothetical protein